ncbi:MAG: hypothetical protein L0241_02645 [Planctomycetia bacterium]|nr:hypothetical protein [Planctomycetia bacterium]
MARKKGRSRIATDDIDLAAALGAQENYATQCFTVYIPNKDKNGKEIGNQRQWILEALALLTELNGDATAMPQTEGVWGNDQGELIWEHPVVVYSFLRPEVFFENLPRVREFLHRMGRETNQGEVAVEYQKQFFLIREFDSATDETGDQE